MRTLSRIIAPVLLFALLFSCGKDGDPGKTQATGFLQVGLNVKIDQIPIGGRASGKSSIAGRTTAVNTDNFIVTIYKSDGTVALVINPFSSAPAQIELPTGTYYIIANSNNYSHAAFDNPYYSGQSANFTIDKGQTKTIEVDCSMTNCAVSFVYSNNVSTTFTDWSAKVALRNEGDFLVWPKTETRSGYFITSPLDITITLSYQMQYSTDVITKVLTTKIDAPLPKTLYRITVDATLKNGQIAINLVVDDGVNTVDLSVTDANAALTGPVSYTDLPGGATWAGSGTNPGFGTKIWDFTGVNAANSGNVYWGPAANAIEASMDGSAYTGNEVMTFSAVDSNLPAGLLVFRGATQTTTGTPVQTMFTLAITDLVTGNPLALIDPTTVGLPANVGGVVKFLNSSQQVRVSFAFTAATGGPYSPFITLYNAIHPSTESGQAFSSFSGGFYY
jgi:hypothetical protein